MESHLRSYDVIIRIGGDEFVCVMSGAAVEDSRQRLVQIQADAAASGLGLRFGIAALEPGDTPGDLIERADSELLSCDAPPIAPPVRVHPRPAADNGCARILVTDDRPEMATVVSSALAERYTCDFAGSLDEAGEMLADNAFDLLLCDLHSGGDAALSFARRTIEGELDTAVILLAEDDDPAQAANAFEFGAFGYVVRPLPGQLLMTAMNGLRRRRSGSRPTAELEPEPARSAARRSSTWSPMRDLRQGSGQAATCWRTPRPEEEMAEDGARWEWLGLDRRCLPVCRGDAEGGTARDGRGVAASGGDRAGATRCADGCRGAADVQDRRGSRSSTEGRRDHRGRRRRAGRQRRARRGGPARGAPRRAGPGRSRSWSCLAPGAVRTTDQGDRAARPLHRPTRQPHG